MKKRVYLFVLLMTFFISGCGSKEYVLSSSEDLAVNYLNLAAVRGELNGYGDIPKKYFIELKKMILNYDNDSEWFTDKYYGFYLKQVETSKKTTYYICDDNNCAKIVIVVNDGKRCLDDYSFENSSSEKGYNLYIK